MRLAGELTALGAELLSRREKWGRLSQLGVAVCPVLDGTLLAETPWRALAGDEAGGAGGIELLVGHTRDEFRLFSVMMGRLGTFTEDDARMALDLFAPTPDGDDAYRAVYPASTPGELLERVYSDALFRMPSLQLAEANQAAGGTSFLFELQLSAPGPSGIPGACHRLDVPLAFGTLDSPTGRRLFGDRPTPEVAAVPRELQQAWVRFATTGDPGWPAYRPGQRLTRVLDAESKTSPDPQAASRAIWDGHDPAPLDLRVPTIQASDFAAPRRVPPVAREG